MKNVNITRLIYDMFIESRKWAKNGENFRIPNALMLPYSIYHFEYDSFRLISFASVINIISVIIIILITYNIFV